MNFTALLLAAVPAVQTSAVKIDMNGTGGQVQMTMPVQILILLTLLTFLPAIVMSSEHLTKLGSSMTP